ncbi:hypothetical protein EON66_04875 [archaeon]|nr:MAG: hypothetical protein EON66_04875 [archaeon]
MVTQTCPCTSPAAAAASSRHGMTSPWLVVRADYHRMPPRTVRARACCHSHGNALCVCVCAHAGPPAGSEPNVFNFVCEIPRGTTPKFEIATGKEWNPITQDRTAAGTPRYYALESIVNYGALPQTYEDPAVTDARTGLAGDGDPLDVCEIGIAKPATVCAYPLHATHAPRDVECTACTASCVYKRACVHLRASAASARTHDAATLLSAFSSFTSRRVHADGQCVRGESTGCARPR